MIGKLHEIWIVMKTNEQLTREQRHFLIDVFHAHNMIGVSSMSREEIMQNINKVIIAKSKRKAA